jgi:hypothetical protein
MAIIALVSPVTLAETKAAPVLDYSTGIANRGDLVDNHDITIQTGKVIGTMQIGADSRLFVFVVTKAPLSNPIVRDKERNLVPGGVKMHYDLTRLLDDGKQSISVDGEKIDRPLPATRGMPNDERLPEVVLAGAVGGLHSLDWVVGSLDGKERLLCKLLELAPHEARVMLLGERGQLTQVLLLPNELTITGDRIPIYLRNQTV